MMNDPFVVGQAKRWGQSLAKIPAPAEERIQQAYLQAFARKPSSVELEGGLAFLKSHGAHFGLDEAKAHADARVWSDYCHVLVNVKEFIYLK